MDAINKGEVPPAFQEELTSRANELVNEVNCPPPPTEDEDEDEDEDEKKDKDKDKDRDGDEQATVPTDPAVTDATPTDMRGEG